MSVRDVPVDSSDIPGPLSESLRSCIKELQQLQRSIDDRSFFVRDRRWKELPADEVIQHDLLHLAKLLAKIADFLDLRDHSRNPDVSRMKSEVVPDLLVYALQIANALEVDLGEEYERRIGYILNKY